MKKLALITCLAAQVFLNAVQAQNNVTVSLVPQISPYFGLWTDTGISVTNGEWITINSAGLWNIGGTAVNGSLTDGIFDSSSDLFLGNGLHGSLVAYVGSDPFQSQWGTSFFPQTTNYWEVGTSVQFQVSTTSTNTELWLGLNDDAVSQSYSDNDGSVTATIWQGFNSNCATDPDLTVGVGEVTTNSFSFFVSNGIPNSVCAIYDSSDLTHWTLIDAIMLNASGSSSGSSALTSISGASVNPMSGDRYANNTGVRYRFYKVSDGQFWSKTVGFVQIPIAGISTNLIANQMDDPNGNSLDGLFNIGSSHVMIDGTSVPAGVVIVKRSGGGIDSVSTWGGTSWSPSGSPIIEPGGNAFVVNLTSNAFVMTFAGLVREGGWSLTLPDGYSYVSSVVPKAGGIQSVLGYNPIIGDTVIKWAGTDYANFLYLGDADPINYPTGWIDGFGNSASEPVIGVGEGVIIQNGQGSDEHWTGTYPLCH